MRYEYVVDGTRFEGTSVERGENSTSSVERARAFLDRHPRGAPVDVMYDPANPATAYIASSLSVGGIILAAFGGLFIAIGVLVATLVLAFG